MSLLPGAIIAADVTGAADLCNTLERRGLRTVPPIGVPGAGAPAPEQPEGTAPCYLLLRGAKTRFLTPEQVRELRE